MKNGIVKCHTIVLFEVWSKSQHLCGTTPVKLEIKTPPPVPCPPPPLDLRMLSFGLVSKKVEKQQRDYERESEG